MHVTLNASKCRDAHPRQIVFIRTLNGCGISHVLHGLGVVLRDGADDTKVVQNVCVGLNILFFKVY